jgi:hypothetical protein
MALAVPNAPCCYDITTCTYISSSSRHHHPVLSRALVRWSASVPPLPHGEHRPLCSQIERNTKHQGKWTQKCPHTEMRHVEQQTASSNQLQMHRPRPADPQPTALIGGATTYLLVRTQNVTCTSRGTSALSHPEPPDLRMGIGISAPAGQSHRISAVVVCFNSQIVNSSSTEHQAPSPRHHVPRATARRRPGSETMGPSSPPAASPEPGAASCQRSAAGAWLLAPGSWGLGIAMARDA